MSDDLKDEELEDCLAGATVSELRTADDIRLGRLVPLEWCRLCPDAEHLAASTTANEAARAAIAKAKEK